MKREVKAQLKRIADALPKVYYKGNCAFIREVVDLRGNEAKNSVVSSPTIIREQSEFMVSDTPTLFNVNHMRRLKKAFKKDGWDGVKEYLAWCKKQDENIYNEVKIAREVTAFENILKEKIKPIF